MFNDTTEYGVYLANGSKYYFDSVTFRGISDDVNVNKVAMYLGGSDHNKVNVVVANYTKAFIHEGAPIISDHCHHWINHNNRLADSCMYELNSSKHFIP